MEEEKKKRTQVPKSETLTKREMKVPRMLIPKGEKGDNETNVRKERKETKKKSYQVEKSMNSIECQD